MTGTDRFLGHHSDCLQGDGLPRRGVVLNRQFDGDDRIVLGEELLDATSRAAALANY